MRRCERGNREASSQPAPSTLFCKAARWEVTVTSFPRRHPRARGDWAGLQFQGLPASDEELFKFHALRSRLRYDAAGHQASLRCARVLC